MKIKIFIVFLIIFVPCLNGICYGDDLNEFLNDVVPKFNKFLKNIPELKDNLQSTGENPYDTLTYAYRLSIRRSEFRNKQIIPLGKWSEEIKNGFFMYLAILCPIKDLLHIRKSEQYQKDLKGLRPKLTKGAYDNMIQQLTVSSKTFDTSIHQLQYKKVLEDKNEFFLESGLKLVRE